MASEPGATMKELPTDGVFAGRPTILPFEGTFAQRVSPAREGERAVGAAAELLDLGRRDGDTVPRSPRAPTAVSTVEASAGPATLAEILNSQCPSTCTCAKSV
jgi:hypothetical protein